MKLFISLFILLISCGSSGYKTTALQTEQHLVQSLIVKDSFDIYITLPKNYSQSKESFSVVYYLDANLKSGNALRKVIDELQTNGKPANAVFVGIGHTGDYRVLRRRDFVTPHLKQGDSLISNETNYGQCENFYRFLQTELIPFVESKYSVSSKRTIVGHSFGGLFAFYCLFKKEKLFTNHIALSPSLWVNYDNIYEFEKKYHQDSSSLHANMYMRAGSRETVNKVLGACRKMNTVLTEKPYAGLMLDYKELEGENHNSHVEQSLRELMQVLKF